MHSPVLPLLNGVNASTSDPAGLAAAFEHPNSGYYGGVAFALVYPFARYVLDRTVFGPLGKLAFFPNPKKTDDPPTADLDNRLYKWKESFWKATVYTLFVLQAIHVSYHERFFTDTRYFWLGCTRFPPCDFFVSPSVRLLYALELGYYLQSIPSLLFWEVRRKDFLENVAHHIATLGLIVYSYQVNFVKVGSMVFLCHDVNDIFLESAKMSRYAESRRMPDVLFAVFVVTWIASRLIYFPFWVIRSVYYEPIDLVARIYNINPHPHWEIFLGLLCFLFALHIYWTYLIIQVVIRQIRKGKVDDVREIDDD